TAKPTGRPASARRHWGGPADCCWRGSAVTEMTTLSGESRRGSPIPGSVWVDAQVGEDRSRPFAADPPRCVVVADDVRNEARCRKSRSCESRLQDDTFAHLR